MAVYEVNAPLYGYVAENLADWGTGQIEMSQVTERTVEQRIDDTHRLVVALASVPRGLVKQWNYEPFVELQDGGRIVATEAWIEEWSEDDSHPRGGFWSQGRSIRTDMIALV